MTVIDHPAGTLISGPPRGRGAAINPANRFDRLSLHVLGDHLDDERRACDGAPPRLVTQPVADRTRRVINRVDSPDLGLDWTLNPYRGCEHGCIYCYARPTHEYLGYSSGLDFETKIIVKEDAPELLRRELAAPTWRAEPIAISGVTDGYQPLEKALCITRRCLEVMAECRQPVGIVTKNRLVVRDVDLLQMLARHDATRVFVSLTTLDADLARVMEPRASRPTDRLRAIRELSAAGVPVSVMIAPVIPGLTDHEMPRLLRAAAEAGAESAAWVMLRLPHQLTELFEDWLRRHRPDRARRVLSAIRGVRGGRLNDATFGRRMRGHGPLAKQIKSTFDVFTRRYGLTRSADPLSSAAFRAPALDGQLSLF